MRFGTGIFVFISVAAVLLGQDVVNYKDLKGVQFREYGLLLTIDSFDCEATIGKKCHMTVSVENKGDKPEPFNATQFSLDNGKGTSYRAVPEEGQSAAGLKKELQPGDAGKFTVFFNGRIHFDAHDPAYLRYGNAAKVRIVK